MAKLTIKFTNTGEEFEIEDVDLKQHTPRQLIDEMINLGLLPPETTAPYGVVNKNNEKIDDDELCLSFAQLGFVDGDTIKIIMRATGGGGCSVIYPNNFQSGYTYEATPLGPSLEEKAQQLADEKVAMSQLEQLKHEEDRCRRHIDKMRYGLKMQKHIKNYCMILRDELPTIEVRLSEKLETEDLVEKMRNLLNDRLHKLQNSTSIIDIFRRKDELKMINELLILLDSFEKGRMEMIRYVQDFCQKKMFEIEQQQYNRMIRTNNDSVFFIESCLSDYERELYDLLEKKQLIEDVMNRKKNESEIDDVFSSIFAPAEVKRKSHMLVQVYLHLFEETEKVKSLAQESQKDAERRDYIPLQCKLKKGDKVDVHLNIYGETLLMSDKKSVIWQGAFTKCSFDYFVPKDIDVDELSCMAMLTVNEIPVGEMRFVTKIVENPRQLHPEILAHKYKKVFISYSHKDEKQVKSFPEGLKLAGIEYFFDRSYLKIGDIFPQVIQDFINSADLFVLFWSENAAKSEYVGKEREQALKLAFPQVKPQHLAKLSIYPMSIEPQAELPSDMKDNYHFGKL